MNSKFAARGWLRQGSPFLAACAALTIGLIPAAAARAADADGDGVDDAIDNCYQVSNAGQQDGDADGIGDACDGCVASTTIEKLYLGFFSFASFTDHVSRIDANNAACLSDVVNNGANSAYSIAADWVAGKIYVADDTADVIYRTNPNGSDLEVLYVAPPGYDGVRGITLDLLDGKMYWCEYDTTEIDALIRRANLDGTVVETVFSSGNTDLAKPGGRGCRSRRRQDLLVGRG